MSFSLLQFFPELVSLQSSLNLYSLCEKHYNQIISTDNFYYLLNLKQLTKLDSIQSKNKKQRYNVDNNQLDIYLIDKTNIYNNSDIQIPKDNHNFGVQVSETKFGTCDFGIQTSETKVGTHDLGIQVSEIKINTRDFGFQAPKIEATYQFNNEIYFLGQIQKIRLEYEYVILNLNIQIQQLKQ